MTKIITVIALLAAHAGLAQAKTPNFLFEGGDNALLATRQVFSIYIDDQVKDGCLPRPNHLQDIMEISLRKSGFSIDNDAPFANRVSISGLGYEVSNGSSCVVSLMVQLEFNVMATVPHASADERDTIVSYSFPVGHTILSGPKNGMQERLEKNVSEAGDRLFLLISRARDDVFSKFPAMKTSFEKGVIKR